VTVHGTFIDTLWPRIRREAGIAQLEELTLSALLKNSIIAHQTFSDALTYILITKLAGPDVGIEPLSTAFSEVHAAHPELAVMALHDLAAVINRDPAAISAMQPFLYFKGFHALQGYRVAHVLWNNGRKLLASHLQSGISSIMQVDIHPAAKIGRGVFLDHATGIVIGETCVIGNNVSMLHNVTLGGNGKETGDRHPKICDGVLLGAGCKVLGNIIVGDGAKIAANSVVLENIPAHTTVAGIPAKAVGRTHGVPALTMNQKLEQ
jgi:serine O-acetyltransferase